MEHNHRVDEHLLHRLSVLLHLGPDRIKLNQSFIQNGGDSLLAIKFSNWIRRFEHLHVSVGAILRTNNLRSLLTKQGLKGLATEQSSCPFNGEDEVVATSSPNRHDHKTLDPIQRIPTVIPTTGLPITFVQAGVAVYTHRVPGAAVQHVTQYCYTDVLPRLRYAFAKAISEFHVFRLRLEVETSPLLVKASWKKSVELNWSECQIQSHEDLEESFRVWSIEASAEPVFRVLTPAAVDGSRSLSVVHWFYHHSLLDGKSMDILLQQVDAYVDTPSLPLKSDDHTLDVVRGLQQYHAPRKGAARAFWATREIPGEARNHPLLRILDGDRLSSRVRMKYTDVFYPENIRTFQSRMGFTLEVLVRGSLALVLSKLQGASNVSFMSVSSRRSLPINDIEDAVSNLATSMVLSIDVNRTETSRNFLGQVFHKVLELEDMSYSDPSDGFSLGGLVVVSSDIQSHTPWYSNGHQTEVMSPKETLPTLYVSPTGRIRFTYNSEWRSPSEIKIFINLFKTAMNGLASGTLTVGECLQNMLPLSQREMVLKWGNCLSPRTSIDSVDDDIMSLFQKQALMRGDAAALELRGRHTSYRNLACMINIISRRIRETFEPGSVIMIHADGSINWIVAMLGVLDAECIFSPQGVNLPHQLRSEHYAIAEARAFLVPNKENDLISPDGCKLRLCVEELLQAAGTDSTTPQITSFRRHSPLSAAYICFSSGTTGKPKAIKCTNSGVVSLLTDPVARLGVMPGTRLAQTMAPPFDGAIQGVFSVLCYGGTLVLRDAMEPFEHLRVADTILTSPSFAAELNPGDYPNVRFVFLGSEVLPQHIADVWSAGREATYNVYGPTECHMVVTAQKIEPGRCVTIGRPFPSARIYILDESGGLVPPLVAGEIHIAGVQVAQGYIGLEDETERRFVPDSIWPSDGGRMYRTGDWGYWTLDGQIAFIGRTDRQVKLGGFRIDLNDVQARLEKAITPKARVVIVTVGDALGCAISDAPPGVGEEQVRAAAKAVLPPQNLPKRIRFLQKMPLSPFGKTDYRAVAKLLET
ncbi:nrps [Acrodontium crateriforme]|uniref:Nrps n=1 Tax=Acrodontium crateriforme TaxID=150365 RepID=A0AAQ3MDA1_9PEZI|nr:nrps [Acrodontium crateriforme]